MGFLDKLGYAAAGGIAIFAINRVLKNNAEEKRRKNTRCFFDGIITKEYFYEVSYNAKSKIKKNMTLEISGPIVSGTVISQSGLSKWNFTVDFNDYGKITGKYWINSENNDSIIPQHLAEDISEKIIALRI
jgi:hypothetical protein